MKGPTPNQYRASHLKGNIIVSAGAGSGKTYTMIERIVDKLIGGAKLEQMLIVTFTRASAADMRFKLSKRLAELKKDAERRGDKKLKSIVADALDAMSVCNIGTLHSYCQKLVRTYFFVAKLDPSATLAEEGETDLMKTAAAQAAVVAAFEKSEGSEFAAVYDILSTRKSDGNVVQTVLDITEYALSVPDPDGFLSGTKDDAEFFDRIDEAFAARRETLCAKLDALGIKLAAAGMAAHVNAVEQLKKRMYDGTTEVDSVSHKKTGGYEDELNDRFGKLKTACKDVVDARNAVEEAKARNGARYARAVCEVAADALERYAASKARQGKIDYADLEHGALKVLRDDKCMDEISRGIKYVFIDEFQDVNPLQSEIAETFRRAGAEMFVVGDVKQSIYGFRRCSPAHFIKAVESAVPIEDILSGAATEADCAGRYVHIPLTDNFRSDVAVIDFINAVFDGKMTEKFGGADYAGRERLVCGKKRTPYKVTGAKFVLFEKDAAPTADGVYSVKNSAAVAAKSDAEAVFIAETVRKWLVESIAKYEEAEKIYAEEYKEYEKTLADFTAGITDSEPEKPTAPEPPTLGEVAVLTRSANAVFYASLAAEFDKRNIPYCFGRSSSVKTYPAAVALVDILRCIDNRFDDVALYTALRSPMGGFSDSQLVEIARDGDAVLAECGRTQNTFVQKAESYRGEYRARLEEFFALRDDIAKAAKKLDCGDTLGYITSKIDYFQHVYESGGDAAAVEAIIDYASERRLDVHGFLAFYDSADFKLEIESGGDAVNITTQHSSKGLEYDLTIVANIGHGFNLRDTNRRVLVSDDGVAVKIPDTVGTEPMITVPWAVANGCMQDAVRQEEMRMLYVALTRAKNMLVVCGKTDDFAKFADEPTPPVGAKCQLDFMRGVPFEKYAPEKWEPIPPVPEVTDESIVAAVKAVCEREMPRSELLIKTCVTKLAHADEVGGGDDYTDGADVLTSDDRNGGGKKFGAKKFDRGKPSDAGADGRLRGTAYHRAMELVDFDSPDLGMLAEKCENHSLVNTEHILRAAEVMKELTAGAERVYRERYFIVDMPPEYIPVGGGQNTLVQGVIDCMAVYADGGVILVDYKTGDPDTLLNDGYKLQLKLYARAVEIATKGRYRVKQAFLYSFEGGKLLPVDVN